MIFLGKSLFFLGIWNQKGPKVYPRCSFKNFNKNWCKKVLLGAIMIPDGPKDFFGMKLQHVERWVKLFRKNSCFGVLGQEGPNMGLEWGFSTFMANWNISF